MPTTTEPKAAPESWEEIPFDDSRIVKYGDPVLRQKAEPLPEVNDEIRALVDEMGDIMHRAHGVGLAAPQIGRSIRLLVYDAGEGLRALINPEISKMKGEQYEPEEGCLSIPGLRGVVRRANEITVKALDRDGSPLRFRAREYEARIIQHEVDHLDGILFIDRAEPDSLHMEARDPEEAATPAE